MFLTASGAEECPWLGASVARVLTSKTTSPEFLSTAIRRGFGLSLPVLKYMLLTSRVAKGGHELDLEVGHVAAIDLLQRRVIPVAVVAHPHQPVLRLGGSIEETLIGRLRRGGRKASAKRDRRNQAGEVEPPAAASPYRHWTLPHFML